MFQHRLFRLNRVHLKLALSLLALLLVLFLARNVWLSALGSALVHDDGPAQADIALVLAGDSFGHRLSRGAEMVKQGYVPRVLVSGPAGFYGANEADAAIGWAVRKGYPAEWFVAVPHTATSTRTEAGVMLSEMRRRNIHSFLLVTSNFHTGRARRIYLRAEREMGGGPSFRVVASSDEYFSPDSWWHSRDGRKTALLEWIKTVTSLLGI